MVVDGGINGDRRRRQISVAGKPARWPARPHLLRYPARYPGPKFPSRIKAAMTREWSRFGAPERDAIYGEGADLAEARTLDDGSNL